MKYIGAFYTLLPRGNMRMVRPIIVIDGVPIHYEHADLCQENEYIFGDIKINGRKTITIDSKFNFYSRPSGRMVVEVKGIVGADMVVKNGRI